MKNSLNSILENYDKGIRLHLSYEFLTADQLAEILKSVNGIYDNIVRITIYDELDYNRNSNIIYYPVPLCITYASTGNSVDIHFGFEKTSLPDVITTTEGIEVLLPEWSAALVLTGLVIYGGIKTIKNLQELRINDLKIQKMKLEVEQLKEATEKLNSKRSSSMAINKYRYSLSEQFLSKNINTIKVNDIEINEKE